MRAVGQRLSTEAPVLCLVTDRRRLSGVRAGAEETAAAVVAQVRAAAEAGVDLAQIREPDLDDRRLADLVERCLAVTRGTSTRVLVNERLDIALAVGAGGVHLRADSIAAGRARELTPPEFLIGCSVHGAEEAKAVVTAGGLDYLIYGTVFATASKPAGHPCGGLEGLARAAHAVDVPVIAIGGITERELPRVHRAGAAGFAAIGFFQDRPAAGGALDLRGRTDRARRLLDAA